VRHFATNATNFSISTLVLQKQHSFKHKRRFSQVHKQQNVSRITSEKFTKNIKLFVGGLAVPCIDCLLYM